MLLDHLKAEREVVTWTHYLETNKRASLCLKAVTFETLTLEIKVLRANTVFY